MKKVNGFSVIMPTYNQAGFIRNAIGSLLDQSHTLWELIIVNDGCTDDTEDRISEYLSLPNVKYLKNERNEGLGAAINRGLEVASHDLVAYLPSDDYYYPDHLEILNKGFEDNSDAVLLFTRFPPNISDSAVQELRPVSHNGLPDNFSLQLVQTAHRKTPDRWMDRHDGDRANLFELFWRKLTYKGVFAGIDETTCNWTPHPDQRHKIILENQKGSIWKYRQHYGIQEPMKLKTSNGKTIDEPRLYGNYRSVKVSHPDSRPLKILLVGELSYNPERVCALEEHGHKLYGLWIRNPRYAFFSIGHLPFGNVTDVPYEKWRNGIREIQPDVIYGLLNYQAVPLARQVMNAFPEIPFVWHFKEGPSFCRQHGIWEDLIDLFSRADGKIYISEESRDWYAQFFRDDNPTLILDGDIPKTDYFTNDFSPKLSASDGEIHTVVPGRMVGMEGATTLSKHRVHIHLYTENYHDHVSNRNRYFQKAMGDCFHVHPHCPPSQWVGELSRYDAGWLHCFNSTNRGVLRNMGWNDLNLPCRMNTLAAAGLPMIQKDNTGHLVAMQSRIRRDDLGVFYKDFDDLARQLHEKERMARLAANVLARRHEFSFDHHVPELVDFFRRAIDHSKTKTR